MTLDYNVNLGQLIVSGMIGALGFGLRQSYKLVAQFVERVNGHEDQLDTLSDVTDQHSQAMLTAGLLKPPFPRVRHRRRKDDQKEEMFT